MVGVETEERPRRRSRHWGRRLRSGLTLLVLLGFLGWATWYGWGALTGQDGAGTAPCRPPATANLRPADVTINVYNATKRSGLAGRTADALEQRGFDVVRVANDPLGRTVKGAVQVRGNANTKAAQRVLRRHLGKFTFVADGRADSTLDVVLGNRFRGLRAWVPPKAGPTGTATPRTDC